MDLAKRKNEGDQHVGNDLFFFSGLADNHASIFCLFNPVRHFKVFCLGSYNNRG